MRESNLERKQVDVGGVVEGWKEDRSSKPSSCEQENLNLKQMKTSAKVATLSKAPGKRKKTKALIAPRVRTEKSLSVIGLPFLPPSPEEEEHAGTCASSNWLLGGELEWIRTIKPTLRCFQPITCTQAEAATTTHTTPTAGNSLEAEVSAQRAGS